MGFKKIKKNTIFIFNENYYNFEVFYIKNNELLI